MTHVRRTIVTAAIAFCAMAATALAGMTGGSLELGWTTTDCGGGTADGAGYELSGTLAQLDAGSMSGGNLVLLGGFWPNEGGGFEPCVGDINGDGMVAVGDLLLLLGAWGCNACPDEDINDDGTVDVIDLLTLLAKWGGCP